MEKMNDTNVSNQDKQPKNKNSGFLNSGLRSGTEGYNIPYSLKYSCTAFCVLAPNP